MIGKPMHMTYAPESLPKARRVFAEWLESGQIVDEEMTILTKSGESRTVLLSADIIRDREGKRVHSVSIQRDITERKRAEEALRASEEKYRTLLENSGVPITYLTIDGTGLLINAVAASFVGIKPEEFSGKSIYETLPQLAERTMERIREIQAAGGGLQYEDSVDFPTMKRWYISSFQPVRDASGKIFAVQIVSQDITKRKQAEERIEHLNSVLRAIRNVNQLLVTSTDPEHLIRAACDALAESRGFSGARIILLDADGNQGSSAAAGCRPCHEYPMKGARMKLAPCAAKALESRAIVTTDERICEGCPWAQPGKSAASACIRLAHRERIHGVLCVCSAGNATMDEEEQDLIQELAADIALGLNNIEMEMRRSHAEEALKDSEARFRALVEKAFDGIAVYDSSGRITYASPASLEIAGVTSQEATGTHALDAVHPDDHSLWHHNMTKLFAEPGGAVAGQYRIRHRDGSYHTLETFTRNLLQDPRVNGLVVNFRDITERVRAETALRESEEKYRKLFETMAQGVVYQKATGEIISANPAAQRILGLTLDEITGRNSSDPRWKSMHEDGTAFPGETHPAMVALRTGQEVKNVIMGVFNPLEGIHRWISINAVPEFRPGEDRPYQAYTTFDDITERKRAEEEIVRAAREWQTTFDATNDAIWILDRDQRVIRSNRTAEKFFHRPLAEMIGKHCWEIAHHTAQPIPECPILRAKRSFHRETMELQTSEQWFEVSVDPITDAEGRYAGAVHIVSDITERKRAENLIRVRLELVDYAGSHSLDELLQKTLDEIDALTGSPIGFYHFVEDDRETLSLQAWSTRTVKEFCNTEGRGRHYPIAEAGVWVDCVRERWPVIHNDYAALSHRKGMPEGHPAIIRELVVPVMRSDRIVAILGVGNKPTDYTQEDVTIVSYLADVAWEITRRKRAEEALKESEAKYSAVVERANDGLAIVHKERIVFVNKALSEITGYSVSELEGKVLLQVMTPESAEYALGIYQRRMSGKPVPSMYQVTALRKDGTTRSVEISAGTIPYRGDLASIAVIRDITERKRAEEALAESEQAFRNLAEHSPSMIFINVRGKVLYANERSAEAMGYTREEYYSPDFDFLTLMDPGSLETVRRNLARHRSGEDVPPYEYTLRTKDGKRIDAIISTKLIQHRGESAILGIVTDITDLKRAQKTIEESERKLSTLMSNLPGIAYRRANNRNWTMHFLSEGCRDLTGYAPEDLLHDRRLAFNDLINPEHRGMVWTETQAALSRREHFSFEYAITTAGGVEKWVWEKGCGIFSPDGRAEILEGFISDVTERKRAEEKLRQSEERNEALLAAVPDIIMEVDTAKVYTWANEAGLEFFGHDVIGKEASFYFEGEQETYGIVQPLFEGAENVIYVESWQRRKDGEKRLLAWWCRVLKDSSGNVTGALSTARDITERKRAEEALRQREYQIRTLFENASDAILYLDESGRVIECNQRIKDIFGYEPEEAIGKSFAEFPFVEPDMMSQILTEFDRMLESGESRLLEFESKRQDGQTLFVEASTRMMDPNTGIRGTLTIIRDITERRKAEAALKESETKYRQLFESISDVVYSVDTEFRILSVSPSVREILGYAPEEIIGKRFTDTNLLTGEDLKLAAEDTLRVLAGEEVIRTYKFIAKDGSIRIGEAKGTPLIREGQTIGTIAVARDITERKRAEEREKEAEKLREIDRMRTDLLANVSHELRTPLTTIKGYATMLTEYPDKLKSEEKTRYLEAIERSSDRLNELIDSLLDMSRIDAGMLRIDRRPSEILPILQQAAAEAQVRSPTHVIVTNVPSQLPMARFDPRRIRQVMDNIIDNAIKYSPKGTTIRVEATRSESNLQVSVSDQGVGIPAAELERVFDRMYRVKRDATARVAGVGLGLSICRGVVDAHGGKIWMESVEGQGSTCFFTLPLDTEEDGHDKQA